MDVQDYIDKGMVESYVLGISSPEEQEEMELLLQEHPELRAELQSVERSIHKLWLEDAVPPPTELRARTVQPYNWADTDPKEPGKKANYTFINIAPNQNDYITVHRAWKWIFLTAFLLFKCCLFLAIYFYFKYRQMETRHQEREKLHQEQQFNGPAVPR